jgi:hypothetical protein
VAGTPASPPKTKAKINKAADFGRDGLKNRNPASSRAGEIPGRAETKLELINMQETLISLLQRLCFNVAIVLAALGVAIDLRIHIDWLEFDGFTVSTEYSSHRRLRFSQRTISDGKKGSSFALPKNTKSRGLSVSNTSAAPMPYLLPAHRPVPEFFPTLGAVIRRKAIPIGSRVRPGFSLVSGGVIGPAASTAHQGFRTFSGRTEWRGMGCKWKDPCNSRGLLLSSMFPLYRSNSTIQLRAQGLDGLRRTSLDGQEAIGFSIFRVGLPIKLKVPG